MHIDNGRAFGWVLRWADRAIWPISLVAGSMAKANPAYFPASWLRGIKFIQEGWLIPALLLTVPIIGILRARFDRRHLTAVHALLGQICERTFKDQPFDHEQHRRVTLFRHCYFTWRRWPFFGGWLIPVQRSGYMTRRTDAIFRAPDDGEHCEGVGGRAWSKKANVYVPGLPCLRSQTVTDEDFAQYAAQSFCSEAKLRKKPPQSRSLLGLPVYAGNKPWGVLVIDCTKEGFNKKVAEGIFKTLSPTLSDSLKGV